MKKIIRTIAASIAALAIAASGGSVELIKVSAEIAAYDGTKIEDDLKDFDLSAYPYDEKGKVTLIQFSEFCYSEKTELDGSYGLYFYVYNPKEISFSNYDGANKINMAIAYNSSGEPKEYANVPLITLDQTEKQRLIKFRIKDASDILANAKQYASAHKGERRYDIAGIQLFSTKTGKAIDYPISSTYRCTGYAKGCGASESETSTLNCTAEKLETIALDIHQSYWRTPWINANGAGHYNQVSSVYFAVPKRFQEKHGKLYAIKCEWDERRTTPIIVTKSDEIYEWARRWAGQKANITDRFGIYDGSLRTIGQGLPVADWGWGYQYETGGHDDKVAGIVVKSSYPVGYVFRANSSNILDSKVSSSEMKKWISDRNFADYLFTDDVDAGRKYGYQEHIFYADQPFDMLSFNATSNGYDKFLLAWKELWSWKLWDTGGDNEKIDPIKHVTDEDFRGIEAINANNLYVHESDYGAFQSYYESKKNANDIFLLRFAITDYYANMQTVVTDAIWWNPSTWESGTKDKESTYMARETVFLHFDIIELTFKYDDKETVIPVVANPIDHIAGIDPPVYVGGDHTDLIWGLCTVGVLFGVIIVTGIIKKFS